MAAAQLEQLKREVTKALYEGDSQVVTALAKLEALSGVKREAAVYTLAGLYALLLVVSHFAELACNFVGFAYPAVESIKAIRSPQKDDDTQWLIYWVVFAIFSLADFFSEAVMSAVPLYWLAKCVLLAWFYLPQTRGAEYVYRRLLEPFLVRSQLLGHGAVQAPSARAAVARRLAPFTPRRSAQHITVLSFHSHKHTHHTSQRYTKSSIQPDSRLLEQASEST